MGYISSLFTGLAQGAGQGIGSLVGKVSEWIPGRTESLRNKEAKIIREIDEILKMPFCPSNVRRYDLLSSELRDIQAKLKNR